MIVTYGIIGYLLGWVVLLIWPNSPEFGTKFVLSCCAGTLALGRWIDNWEDTL